MFLIIWYFSLYLKDSKSSLKLEIGPDWLGQDFDNMNVFGYYSNQRVREYLQVLFVNICKKRSLVSVFIIIFFLVPSKIFLYREKKDIALLFYA